MQQRIWVGIGVAALAWGTTGVATRAALGDGFPPFAMVTVRAVIATGLLTLLLRVRRHRFRWDRKTWTLGLVAGTFQLSVPFVLFTLAYQHASAGFVGLLVALVPLATAIMAHFRLDGEAMTTATVAGLLVAFLGVGFLLVSGDSGLGDGGRPLLSALLSIAAVTSIAASSVYTKGREGGFDPTELTWMQFLVGIVLVGSAMLVAEGFPSCAAPWCDTPGTGAISPWGWQLVVYLSVVGSVLPFLLYYWVLVRVTSTKASLVGYLVPPIAVLSGFVFLDERLQPGIVGGGAMILVGVVLTDRAERQRAPALPI